MKKKVGKRVDIKLEKNSLTLLLAALMYSHNSSFLNLKKSRVQLQQLNHWFYLWLKSISVALWYCHIFHWYCF